MNVALIHDHLAQNGGAERVLQVLHDMFPSAPTYVTVWNKAASDPVFHEKDIRTSFIQNLPFGVKKYQWYLPFMPVAFEKFDLSGFDFVLSSNSALAKGVIPPEGVPHVCYCYTPTRYLWSDRNTYPKTLGLPKMVRRMLEVYLSYLRTWDLEAARRVDHFISISHVVQQRIKHYYKRDSEIIYPPVETTRFSAGEKPGDYFITGGRLTYYKRFDITVQAFSKTGYPLYVYGDGPEKEKLQEMASPNVKFLGRVSEERLEKLYKEARAFINPQVEDFGITMVEAMAAGRPVIALNEGGAVDIVQEGLSGEFFDEQNWEALADTVIRFDASQYNPQEIKQYAEKFSRKNFENNLQNFLKEKNLLH